jgi:putative phosphoesterase
MNHILSQCIEIPGDIEELFIISDIHGYRQVLEGFDKAISGKTTRYQILFCGDLYAPGIQPVECTAWVMEHAGRLAVRGNHDDEMLDAEITLAHEPLWSEAGAKQNLSDERLEYMSQLPHRLEVSWRDKRIVLMHGHIRPDGGPGNFITTPQEQMELFYDEHADLCVMGHSHYPYVRKSRNTLMANCGSMSIIMAGMLTSDGLHAQSGESFDPDGDTRPSFITVTTDGPELLAEISRFQVDQAAMIEDLLAVQCPYTGRMQRCMQDGIADLRTPEPMDDRES